MELTSQLHHVQNNNVNSSKYFVFRVSLNTTLTFKNSAVEKYECYFEAVNKFWQKKQIVCIMISQLHHKSKCDGVDCDGVDII